MSKKSATHEGVLDLGPNKLNCAVLNDGSRIITATAIFKAFDRPRKGKSSEKYRADQMPSFINANNLQKFIDQDFRERTKLIEFTSISGEIKYGYDARIIRDLCKVYIDARRADELLKTQERFAEISENILYWLADRGIESLVDRATGYHDSITKAREDIEKFLLKMVSQEKALSWVKTFPDSFFEMIFTMNNWPWNDQTKNRKPGVVGHYINDYVYSRLGPLILDELRKKNPINEETGVRSKKHHQWLTADYGHPKLREHFISLDTVYKLSGGDKKTFETLLDRVHPKFGKTIQLLFPEENATLLPPVNNVKDTSMNRILKGMLAVPPPRKDKQNDEENEGAE